MPNFVFILKVITAVLLLSSLLTTAGKITGVLIDEDGMPARQRTVEASPIDMGYMGDPRQFATTNARGEFELRVFVGRSPDGKLYGGSWLVCPVGDEARLYPELFLSPNFYSTELMGGEIVKLTPENSTADGIRLRLVRAGVLTGTVRDAVSGAPLKDVYFGLAWARDPKHAWGGGMGANHRILLPPNTDLKLKVLSPGHEPWFYPSTINVGSGQEIKLDIQLQPSTVNNLGTQKSSPSGKAAPGIPRGVVGDMPGGLPAEPQSPRAASPTRIRVAQGVMRSFLVTKVNPSYPREAERQHVDGMVLLHINIDRNGNVSKVELVSGHPLLVPAAIDAVRQWKYRPYLLKQKPVEVETTVLIKFVMSVGNTYSVIAFGKPR